MIDPKRRAWANTRRRLQEQFHAKTKVAMRIVVLQMVGVPTPTTLLVQMSLNFFFQWDILVLVDPREGSPAGAIRSSVEDSSSSSSPSVGPVVERPAGTSGSLHFRTRPGHVTPEGNAKLMMLQLPSNATSRTHNASKID
jgi:hypothetical protein